MSQSKYRDILRRALFLGPHTCPWWFAYTFDNPLRGWVHDPNRILDGLVQRGDTVVDLGCGLGFFTHALAQLVGPQGRVVAVDLQTAMLERNRERASRLGLVDRIEFRRCEEDRLDLNVAADFVLAFWMVHEVRHPEAFLAEVHAALRPEGNLLIAEPRVHVPAAFFARTTDRVRGAGFDVGPGPEVRFSRSILCKRTAPAQM